MLRTYQGNLSEVGVFAQQEHQGFCFGVPEPHVVLEDFGTILSYHETSKQDTDKREAYLTLGGSAQHFIGRVLAFFSHPVYGRL